VRGQGISENVAVDLMREHWASEKLIGENDPEYIADKVRNAYKYGSSPPGANTAEADFAVEPPPADAANPSGSKAAKRLYSVDLEQARQAKRRPSLIKGLFHQGSIAVTYGDSNVGKSFVALDRGRRRVDPGEEKHERCRNRGAGCIVAAMPTRRRAASTPDLFASLPSTARAPDRPARLLDPQREPKPDPASQSRHLLPRDLAGALKRLENAEVDALLAAVTAEARRRGRAAPTSQRGEPPADVTSRSREPGADIGAPSLTTGKLNAVRAAFKAGVRPSAIARQFGISQADVKSALAAQKSGR